MNTSILSRSPGPWLRTKAYLWGPVICKRSTFVEGFEFVDVYSSLAIFRQRLGGSLSMTLSKRAALTADEPLRRQEEQQRKWARLSPLVDGESGASSELV